jgi:hypothetical protein
MRLFLALLALTLVLTYLLGSWVNGILSQVRF